MVSKTSEIDLTIIEEFNADWSYYCIYEHEDTSSLNEFIYIEENFDLSYNEKAQQLQ